MINQSVSNNQRSTSEFNLISSHTMKLNNFKDTEEVDDDETVSVLTILRKSIQNYNQTDNVNDKDSDITGSLSQLSDDCLSPNLLLSNCNQSMKVDSLNLSNEIILSNQSKPFTLTQLSLSNSSNSSMDEGFIDVKFDDDSEYNYHTNINEEIDCMLDQLMDSQLSQTQLSPMKITTSIALKPSANFMSKSTFNNHTFENTKNKNKIKGTKNKFN